MLNAEFGMRIADSRKVIHSPGATSFKQAGNGGAVENFKLLGWLVNSLMALRPLITLGIWKVGTEFR
jgi:hypothetical protein